METGLEMKLKRFSGTVLKDAEIQRDKIEEDIERERNSRLSAKEDEFLADAYMNIQHNITQIQKEDNEKVLHAELEARKAMLKKREEIIDNVFELAKARIEDFMNTQEYKEKLAAKIADAVRELGEGRKIVYLTQKDKDVFDSSCGAELVLTAPKEFIGGVKAVNTDRDIAVDYSYYELLLEARGEFLPKSGLSLSQFFEKMEKQAIHALLFGQYPEKKAV